MSKEVNIKLIRDSLLTLTKLLRLNLDSHLKITFSSNLNLLLM